MKSQTLPSIAPPAHLRPYILEFLILLHRTHDAEADVVGFGHPPDALRALRVALEPVFFGKAAGGPAAFVGRVDPRAAAGDVAIALVGRRAERVERRFIEREAVGGVLL